MTKFGFKISTTRAIDLDDADKRPYAQLLEAVPSYRYCIGCGGCTATCSAGQFTDFNIRKTHFLFSRRQYDKLSADVAPENDLKRCMLCGKCTLVCPRGVNTRGLILEMRRLLNNNSQFSILNSQL